MAGAFCEADLEAVVPRLRRYARALTGNREAADDLTQDTLERAWQKRALWQPGSDLRAWTFTIMKVLDIAGGTGDLAKAFAQRAGATGEVWLSDINGSMLAVGRDRLFDSGLRLPLAQCDAEKLPFPSGHFDLVSVAFGLRNMTHKDIALAEMQRVLKPGGRLLVLEFSRIWQPLAPFYDAYSFKVLPWLGKKIAGDSDSYRYLAESIRMHPPQEELAKMMEQAGFDHVQWFNLTAGVCALHVGTRY